jgi:parallel beta-helix repeat protein
MRGRVPCSPVAVMVFVSLILVMSQAVAAVNPTTGGPVEAGANYATIQVIAYISGDDNGNGSATVFYRPQGQPAWQQGHPLYRMDATRYAGVIFYLTADATYEVDVQLSDPDGVSGDPAPFLVSTRSETIPGQGTGRPIYVSPTGDDNNPGTQASPYQTIGKAHSVSLPGDTIHVLPGVYREAVTITRSGSPSAYITYQAEGAGVILDSSDPAYLDGTPDWTPYSGNVYVAACPNVTTYVAADGVRLYRRSTLSALKRNGNGVYGGFYYDSAKKKLYVSIPGPGGDPDNHVMNVATLRMGVTLQANYIVIDGFEIRYYGNDDYQTGIFVDGKASPVGRCNVIRNNTIHNTGEGIWVRGTNCADNLIANNEIYDVGVTSWVWAAVKGTEIEETGIGLEAGWGNVVRDNIVHGQFNGIGPGAWDALTDEAYNGACDVYGNVIYDISDDCLEPEGACVNVAMWDNDLSNFHMGISVSPITVGPIYFFRNVMWDWPNHSSPQSNASALKIGNSTEGRQYFYHNTYCTPAADQTGITPNGNFFNTVSRNNILYASWYAIEDTNNGGGGTSSWDYDDIFTTYDNPAEPRYVKWANVRYYTLPEWQAATGQETNGIDADPLFANLSGGDLMLLPGSPCIDRGEVIPNINDGYLGAAPDLGAYEMQ